MSSSLKINPSKNYSEVITRLAALFSIDFRSLAAFRIMASLTLLYVCIVLSLNLRDFYSVDGILDIGLLKQYFPYHRFTILEYFPGDGVVWFLLTALFVSTFFLLIGYKSRIAAAVCFFIYLSFVGRNPLILQGGDFLLPLLLFWAIFLPTGRVFGLDGALEKDRDVEASPAILSVATVGLLLQVLYVYVFGALLKTSEVWIPGGQAVYIALHLDSFATTAAHFLREYAIITLLLTYFVFYLELLAPLFLFFPDKKQRVRAITLSLIMMMHIGFRFFLSIGHFWMSSLTSLMAYIPTQTWNWICKNYWDETQRQIRIFYDRDCGFCLKTCLLMKEFFLPHNVSVSPAQDVRSIGEVLERENSWVVVAPDGTQYLRWEAVEYITKQSIIMRPFWLLTALIRLIGFGNFLYKTIGNNRGHLSTVSSLFLPYNSGPKPSYKTVNVCLSMVLAFCFVWNLDQNQAHSERSEWLKAAAPVAQKIGLAQRWNMFAPKPALKDGYPIISVTSKLGEEFHVTSGGSFTESNQHPERLESYYSTYRWRKYFNRIAKYEEEKRAVFFGKFAAILCKRLEANEVDTGKDFQKIAISWASNYSFRQKENEYTIEKIGEWDCSSNSLRTASAG